MGAVPLAMAKRSLVREAGWVADLGEDLCCGQRSDAVDAGEAPVSVLLSSEVMRCVTASISRQRRRMSRMRLPADLGACADRHRATACTPRRRFPAPLVSGPVRLWYPQRIFSR